MKKHLFALGLLALVSNTLESKATYYGNGHEDINSFPARGYMTVRAAVYAEEEDSILMTQAGNNLDLPIVKKVMPAGGPRSLDGIFAERDGFDLHDPSTLILSRREPHGNIDVVAFLFFKTAAEVPTIGNVTPVKLEEFIGLISGTVTSHGLSFGLQRLIKNGTTSGPIDQGLAPFVREFFEKRTPKPAAAAAASTSQATESSQESRVSPETLASEVTQATTSAAAAGAEDYARVSSLAESLSELTTTEGNATAALTHPAPPTLDDAAASASTTAAGSRAMEILSFATLAQLPSYTSKLERLIISREDADPLIWLLLDEIEKVIESKASKFYSQSDKVKFTLIKFWWEGNGSMAAFREDTLVKRVTEAKDASLTLAQIEAHVIASAVKKFKEQAATAQ